ncbi:hypothetical protein [Burkholderia sp. Bp9031]|uniref:hypothetical protein n=1 Tax=Burkholderia sp. Bp9031 TaxID=2184566 RepID=UPI000F5F619A|nr:hypothetical protein [Burkholderia sp. Bp9031]
MDEAHGEDGGRPGCWTHSELRRRRINTVQKNGIAMQKRHAGMHARCWPFGGESVRRLSGFLAFWLSGFLASSLPRLPPAAPARRQFRDANASSDARRRSSAIASINEIGSSGSRP